MAAAYPSGTNTFVPSFEASGHLIVAYSRNPKDFAVNKYAAIKQVKKSSGYYLVITAEEAARVLDGTNVAEAVWHDGNDAPSDVYGNESFEFKSFNTTRRQWGFNIGYKAAEQADWKLLAQYAAFKAQQAMTARTQLVWNKITTSGNWAATHYTTFKLFTGGSVFSNAGTSIAPVLKQTFNAMAQLIHKDTLGAVRQDRLQIVIDPVLADAWGRSQEVHDYLKNTPFALAQVRGDVPNQNGLWGLPERLYNYPIVVEDAVRTTTKKGAATQTRSFIPDGNTFAMLSKPDALVTEAGGVDFSTVQMFMYEEMTVESRDDVDNRRTKSRVVEDYDTEIVAPASGAVATNCIS